MDESTRRKILQRDGNNAKPCQVRLVRVAILKCRSGDLEMTKYEVVIYWSEEDQTFVAEAPELSGCASRGSTQEAALAGLKEAIRLWVEMAKELGHPVPHAKGRRLTSA